MKRTHHQLTYHSRFNRRIQTNTHPCNQEDGRDNTHHNQRQLPLHSQRHNEPREKQRNPLHTRVQLLRNPLINPIPIYPLPSANAHSTPNIRRRTKKKGGGGSLTSSHLTRSRTTALSIKMRNILPQQLIKKV